MLEALKTVLILIIMVAVVFGLCFIANLIYHAKAAWVGIAGFISFFVLCAMVIGNR